MSIPDSMILHIFLRTIADGDCLFNACSLALVGDESLLSCLRPLTSIELYLNFVKRNSNLNKNILCQFLSFEALDSSYVGGLISAVYKEAENNTTRNTFSSSFCLLALSTVTKQRIECYFPIANDDLHSEDE